MSDLMIDIDKRPLSSWAISICYLELTLAAGKDSMKPEILKVIDQDEVKMRSQNMKNKKILQKGK